MSARVSLVLMFAWSMMATAPAIAQRNGGPVFRAAGRTSVDGPVIGVPATGEAATGGRTAAAEHISNAPRSVSYAEAVTTRAPNESLGQAASPVSADASKTLAPMPLPPRSQPHRRQTKESTGRSSGRALVTVISSLAIVLGVFFAFVWVTRSAAPKGMAPLSKDVVESLGRAPLLGRQQMQLIRVGNKLILLSVTATGAEPLTEITDPVEVDRLAGLCRQAQSGSITDTFRQVLAQASSEPATTLRSHPRQTGRAGSRETYRA